MMRCHLRHHVSPKCSARRQGSLIVRRMGFLGTRKRRRVREPQDHAPAQGRQSVSAPSPIMMPHDPRCSFASDVTGVLGE